VAIRASKQLFNGSRQLNRNKTVATAHSQERASRILLLTSHYNQPAGVAMRQSQCFKRISVLLKCRGSNSGNNIVLHNES